MSSVAKRESHLHGLLIVDKPGRSHSAQQDSSLRTERLLTSHDVVQRVRRWSQQRRIGHTGTLDPLASGVLVLCLGQATRLVEYYQGHAKQYYAEIVLGAATDTYDALGQITQRSAIPDLDQACIESALEKFRGEILQTPPIYSAIKQGGESLHRKARRGETVTLTPRPVNFYQLDFINYTSIGETDNRENRLVLRACCSAGGYIRSLAHDLGLALGTHGYLNVLRREQAGAFGLAEAYTFDEIEAASQDNKLADLLLPLGYGLQMPKLEIGEEIARRLGYGQRVPMKKQMADPTEPLAQAVDSSGKTLGIIRCTHPVSLEKEVLAVAVEKILADSDFTEQGSVWKAEKWFQ